MSAGREPVISRPLKRMRPRVGARKWVRRLKQVVLPAPLGPMSAWIAPRRTRSRTPFTARKPRNSLVRSSVSRMTSSAISGARARRKEAGLALLAPRAIGLLHLPRRLALVLRPQDVLELFARVAMERAVEQPLGVGVGGRRRGARLADDIRHRPLQIGARADAIDEAHGVRLGGAYVLVQQGQLLGAPHADDARQPQHGAVGNEPVARGAETDDRVVAGHAQIA